MCIIALICPCLETGKLRYQIVFPNNCAVKIAGKSYYGLSTSTLKFHLLKQTLCTSGIQSRICLIETNGESLIYFKYITQNIILH